MGQAFSYHGFLICIKKGTGTNFSQIRSAIIKQKGSSCQSHMSEGVGQTGAWGLDLNVQRSQNHKETLKK